MLYLKKINYEDIDEEYRAIKAMPQNENGFENKYYNVTKEEFEKTVIPTLIKHSEGLELPEGYVPDTYFFLWDDDKIVGLFKIRHYLNDFLRQGAGHIGYGILPDSRGKGYAKKGLQLAIDKCRKIISEEEIYLSVHKNNPVSLRVQLRCGAYIVGETKDEYLTRIRLNDNDIEFGYRDLKRDDWKRIIKKKTIIEDIKNDIFEGKVCFLKMKEVESPLTVASPIGKVKIADNNYSNLIFAPKNQNWWLTVMFDDNDNLIESYFDITKINNFDIDDNPYFVDMKLDVCIPFDGKATMMDEEELEEALECGKISEADYTNAYNTANKIINYYNSNKESFNKFISDNFRKYKAKVNE